MSLYDTPIGALDGTPDRLSKEGGKATLMVNVASKCGLTPQYEGLERLQERYGDQGFSVLGFPCNQFLEQEPGTADEIAGMVSYLASAEAAFVTGASLTIDGGLTA